MREQQRLQMLPARYCWDAASSKEGNNAPMLLRRNYVLQGFLSVSRLSPSPHLCRPSSCAGWRHELPRTCLGQQRRGRIGKERLLFKNFGSCRDPLRGHQASTRSRNLSGANRSRQKTKHLKTLASEGARAMGTVHPYYLHLSVGGQAPARRWICWAGCVASPCP